MKKLFLLFALIIGLLTSASTAMAQTVNMSSYITLTVAKDSAIRLNLKAAAEGTPVRIVSGGTFISSNDMPSAGAAGISSVAAAACIAVGAIAGASVGIRTDSVSVGTAIGSAVWPDGRAVFSIKTILPSSGGTSGETVGLVSPINGIPLASVGTGTGSAA